MHVIVRAVRVNKEQVCALGEEITIDYPEDQPHVNSDIIGTMYIILIYKVRAE